MVNLVYAAMITLQVDLSDELKNRINAAHSHGKKTTPQRRIAKWKELGDIQGNLRKMTMQDDIDDAGEKWFHNHKHDNIMWTCTTAPVGQEQGQQKLVKREETRQSKVMSQSQGKKRVNYSIKKRK